MNRRILTLGVGAGLAAGSFAGLVAVPAISMAQTSTTTAPSATEQGRPDPSARLTETLKPLVDAGTISQAQSDAVVETLVANAPRGGMKGRGGPGMDVAAQALGMTNEELRTALQGGQTLAQVAESKGVSTQVLTDALTAGIENHIAQEVADGRIDQARADEMLAKVDQRVTDMLDGVRPKGGRGPRGHGQPPAESSMTN